MAKGEDSVLGLKEPQSAAVRMCGWERGGGIIKTTLRAEHLWCQAEHENCCRSNSEQLEIVKR